MKYLTRRRIGSYGKQKIVTFSVKFKMNKKLYQLLVILLIICVGLGTGEGHIAFAEGGFHIPEVKDDFNQFEQNPSPQQEKPVDIPPTKEKGLWDSVTESFKKAADWTKDKISGAVEWTTEKASAFWEWITGVLSKITEVFVDALTATWDWIVKFKEYIAFAGVLILSIALCFFAPPLGAAVLTGMALSLFIGAGLNGWKFDKTVFLEAAIGGLLGLIGGGITGGATRIITSSFGKKLVTSISNSRVLGSLIKGGQKLIGKLPKPMQQIFGKAGFIGFVEGAGTNIADDLLHRRKINWRNAFLSGVTGAALVGAGAFIIPKVEPLITKVTTAFQKTPVVKVAKQLDDCLPFAYQQPTQGYLALANPPFTEFSQCVSAKSTNKNGEIQKAELKQEKILKFKTEKPKYDIPDRNFTIKDGKDKQGRTIKYAVLPNGQEVKLLSSQYAGGTNKNGIPFDKDGFVDFSEYVEAEVYLKPEQLKGNSQTQTSQATRILRDYLNADPKLKKEFLEKFPENERDLIEKHLESGNHKIGNYTWHHHQETGRMQLIPTDVHRKGYPHTGGHRLWGK